MVLSRSWRVALGALLVVLFLGLGTPAHADALQDCVDQAQNHNGEPPTCIDNGDGTYTASWDDGVGGSGIPSGFVVLFILVAIAGVGLTVWKVSTARRLATESGMDPNTATAMTLLTEDGLDATYLASSLRGSVNPAPAPAPAPRAAADRLTELKGLLDSGAITQAEYDERRKAIIDGV